MVGYKRIGRPGALGSRKDEVLKNYDKVYGVDNWRLVWNVNGTFVELDGALAIYEDAYFEHFKKNPDELKGLTENFANVYDNNISNVESWFDYYHQEFKGNHFQDIAIRRCLIRNGLWFKGTDLLEVRMREPGIRYNPGRIPFHRPEWIPQPELEGFWEAGTVESWYQSAKYLEVKNFDKKFDKDLYFITSNVGKVNSARRSLGEQFSLEQLALEISEEQETIEKIATHKARIAYATICRPVITDDSGFVIPDLGGYPGIRIGRELKERGIEHFLAMAKERPLDAYFLMTLAYFESTLKEPKLFTSKVEGKLISEQRGDVNKPFVKSLISMAFIINGQDKTIGEMTEEEYKANATTDRWKELLVFLKNREKEVV